MSDRIIIVRFRDTQPIMRFREPAIRLKFVPKRPIVRFRTPKTTNQG